MKLNLKVLLSFLIISIIIVLTIYPINDAPKQEGMRNRLEPQEILFGTEDGYEEPVGFDFDDHTGDISALIEERNGREEDLDNISRNVDNKQDTQIKQHSAKNVKPHKKPSAEEVVKSSSAEENERTERAKQTHSSHAEIPKTKSTPKTTPKSKSTPKSNNPYDCLGSDGLIDPKKCPDALSYCKKPTKITGNCEEAVITIDGKQYKQCYGICTDPDKCIDDEMCKGTTEYLPVQ